MNPTADSPSRKDSIVAIVGLLVLLLGVATGNAIAMLVMSVVGLVGIAILDCQRLGRTTWLAITVSAIIAAVTVIAISMFG